MTLSELHTLFDTTTIINPDYGLTATVFPVSRGWMVRFVDDDSGSIIEQSIYPTEAAALAYAHKLAGVTP